MKKLLKRALAVLESYNADEFVPGAEVMRDIRAELTKPEQAPPNKVTATAPKEIYLCISDDPDDAETEFNYFDVDWCEEDPVDVCVKYIRADLK